MVERLGEMSKLRKEKIEKGSRERIEKREKRKRQKGVKKQFEEEVGIKEIKKQFHMDN